MLPKPCALVWAQVSLQRGCFFQLAQRYHLNLAALALTVWKKEEMRWKAAQGPRCQAGCP